MSKGAEDGSVGNKKKRQEGKEIRRRGGKIEKVCSKVRSFVCSEVRD